MISPYYTNLDIPYEVVIPLIKNSVWEKICDGDCDNTFKTVILGKEKATKVKLEKIKTFIKEVNSNDKYKITDDDFKLVTIRNKDFNLSLVDNPDRRYCLNFYGYQLNFSNKNLKVKYNLSTYINDYNMIELINSCSYVTDRKIHGNFFYKNEFDFYQYNPEDRNLIENLSRVECIGSNRKTTNFKIGHKYILKNKAKIIYLGTISKDVKFRKDYSWNNESNHSYFINTVDRFYKYSSNLYYHLFLNLDIIYNYYGYNKDSGNKMSTIEEFVEMSKGKTVCEFLIKLITYFESNSTDKNMYDCICYSDSLQGGVDVEEYFNDCDSDDIVDTLNSICFERVEHILSQPGKKDASLIIPYVYGMNSDYLVKFNDSTKEVLFDLLIKPSLQEMFRKNSFRLKAEVMTKIKAENSDVNNLYKLYSSIGSYYCEELGALVSSKDSIANLIFKGSESKLNNLILECKKAYVK